MASDRYLILSGAAFSLKMSLLLLLSLLSLGSATSFPNDHLYNAGDLVPLFVNKVGPLHNPSETYQFYDLPFCRPDPIIQKKESLGEVLNGDRLANALFDLQFRKEKTDETLCEKKLQGHEVAKFRDAVSKDFYFQMYYDDLPLWGFIGKVEEQSWITEEKVYKYYLFTHMQFDVLYNGNQVIEINAFADPNHVLDITQDIGINVKFSYSVFWNATSAQFQSRMDKYSRASLLPIHRQVHWFSFINSIVIVVLLTGLLTVLFMRRLKNDLRKCSSGDEEEEGDKEIGWKHIHGDVFRHPQNISLFCAFLGIGTQILALVGFLFLLAFLGILHPYNRGVLCTSLIFVYTLTSVIAGYTTASSHSQFARTGWERSVLLTGILFLGPVFVILSILNIIAASYGSTAAIPFGSIVVIFLVYIFVTIPLLALGGLIGYIFRSEFQPPTVTKRYAREVPPLAWYRKTPCQMFLGGFLSFSAIVLELHHLYTSLWGYKISTLPGILLFSFIMLAILTAISSIGMTYIQLSVEDHEWWWSSILRGASTAIFMFGYCFYFYARSSMCGLLQLSFFLGYNACLCYAFFLMLGTISFRASFMFVCHIYRAVKIE